MSFIAIDLGTSFIKGGILDLDRMRIEHIERVPFPNPVPGLAPLCREYNPHQILAAVRDLIDRLKSFANQFEGLVMCSQMHGIVLMSQSGDILSNLTTWQDQRVLQPHPSGKGSYFDVLLRNISPPQVHELGNELRPGLPVGLFFWLAEQKRLPPSDVIPASLPDFVLASLCNCEPSVDLTNAMAYGLLNLKTLNWHSEVMLQLGIDRLHLPTIRRQGEMVSRMKLGATTIPCFTPVGDYQCALTGALLKYGELSLNISTGSQVSLLKPHMELGDYQTRPFFDGRFANTITHIPAGRSLNLLVQLLTEVAASQSLELADPWDYIIRQVSQVTQTDLSVNLAFFTSSCGDHGEMSNIREENLTVGHLFRAAFENMATNYFTCAQRIAPDKSWQRLVFSGGLAQKIDSLREIICAKFRSEYRVCPSSEDTLLGLLALALTFSGRVDSVEQATQELWHKYITKEASRWT